MSDYDDAKDQYIFYRDTWSGWFDEAKTDERYYLGDMWDSADKRYLQGQNRKPLTINKNIRRFVHLLSGYQRQNVTNISYSPWEGSDNLTAEQMTLLATFFLEKMGGHDAITAAFDPAVKVGLDWVNIYPGFEDDPESGDIYAKRTPWNRIICDPRFFNPDGSDIRELFRVEEFTKEQVNFYMPWVRVKDIQAQGGGGGYSIEMSLSDMMQGRGQSDKYHLLERWVRDKVPAHYMIDVQSGEEKEINIKDRADVERVGQVLQMFPQVKVINKEKKSSTLELYLNDTQLYKGPDPYGSCDVPYVPIMCYYDPEYDDMKWRLQGIVRALRDSADEYNKRRSQILHAINTMVLSGVMYEDNVLFNEDDINNFSGAGVKLKVKPGAIAGGKIKELSGKNLPNELFKLEEMLASDPVDITGINAELLASMDKDTPGISIQLRQRQGLVAIQNVFDNLRKSKRRIGNMFAKMVQTRYTPRKVMRILGDQPAPSFFNREFTKYDCSVTEAENSPTQKLYLFHKAVWYHQNVSPMHPMIMIELADMPEKYRNLQMQFTMSQLMGGQPGQPPQGGGGGSQPSSGERPKGKATPASFQMPDSQSMAMAGV
jgi:hypothetical protein